MLSNALSSDILVYLKEFWEKQFNCKVVIKKIVFHRYALDGFIVLPRLKGNEIRSDDDLVSAIRSELHEDIPKGYEIVGIRIKLWNRPVGYMEYIKAKQFLRKQARIDKILLIVGEASQLLREYTDKDGQIMLLEYGEIISFLKKRGIL